MLMSPLPDGIITSMKKIFHIAKLIEERIPRHKLIQDSILELFNCFNFRVKKKYRIQSGIFEKVNIKNPIKHKS